MTFDYMFIKVSKYSYMFKRFFKTLSWTSFEVVSYIKIKYYEIIFAFLLVRYSYTALTSLFSFIKPEVAPSDFILQTELQLSIIKVVG